MNALDEPTQTLSLAGLLPPEVGEAFVGALWKDLAAGRVSFEPHSEKPLRKNAIETSGQRYPPLQALHWGLTPTVATLLDIEILPSFAYFRIYFGGDICRIHSDRADCQFSLSVVLSLSDAVPWELNVGTRPAIPLSEAAEDFGDEPFISFPMSAGDAILYRGAMRRHGRLSPNPNRWSAQPATHPKRRPPFSTADDRSGTRNRAPHPR